MAAIIGECVDDCRGHGRRLVVVDEITGVVVDHAGNVADRRGQDRKPGFHSFQEGHR